jgi:hypothetical protein
MIPRSPQGRRGRSPENGGVGLARETEQTARRDTCSWAMRDNAAIYEVDKAYPDAGLVGTVFVQPQWARSVPTALDNDRRSPEKLPRSVAARLLRWKPWVRRRRRAVWGIPRFSAASKMGCSEGEDTEHPTAPGWPPSLSSQGRRASRYKPSKGEPPPAFV